MANIKTAKKRILVNKKNEVSNKNFRTNLKTAIKKAEFALENKSEDTAVLVKDASVKLDRAAQKGILHINNAARKKAQLAKKLNNM